MDPEPSWGWAPGQELAPGLLAWALLGDGRRCETWLACGTSGAGARWR